MFIRTESGRQALPAVKQLQNIRFGKSSVEMIDIMQEKFRLPYDEIVMAYIEARDKKTGNVYRPEMADITEDVDGELVFRDCHNRRLRLEVGRTGKKAGYILKQLALYAPYILMDFEGWLEEEDEEEFTEARRMVSIMRELPDKKNKRSPFRYL